MLADETITPWLLGRTLKQADMTVEDLRELLQIGVVEWRDNTQCFSRRTQRPTGE